MSAIDKRSETWAAVVAAAKKKITECRGQIEADGLDHSSTQFLRGHIAALRSVIALAEPELAQVVADEIDTYDSR